MRRDNTFHHATHEPLRSDPTFTLKNKHTRGPFSFLNPTRTRLDPTKSILTTDNLSDKAPSYRAGDHAEDQELGQQPKQELSQGRQHQTLNKSTKDEVPASSIQFEWRSRDNRKGRHKLLVIPASSPSTAAFLTPPSTSTPRAVLRGIRLMLTCYPIWDVSYLVAIIFTLGSVIWVINGFFALLPLVQGYETFAGESTVAAGWSAFVGATVFEVGSVLLMFEAVNENRAGCFGWALEKVVEEVEGGIGWRVEPERKCRHHHSNRGNFVGRGSSGERGSKTSSESVTARGGSGQSNGGRGVDAEPNGKQEKREEGAGAGSSAAPSKPSSTMSGHTSGKAWQWFPTAHELFTYYIYELGFLACAFQLFGATVFWISGFTAIPQIQDVLIPYQPSLNGAYWTPQIVGGAGFIVSSLFFMLETQRKWYIPAPTVLGWHIGLWNLVGAVGFTVCGALGPGAADSDTYLYQSILATFWGSWAFLVGSAVQWFESLDTHPIEERKGLDGGEQGKKAGNGAA